MGTICIRARLFHHLGVLLMGMICREPSMGLTPSRCFANIGSPVPDTSHQTWHSEHVKIVKNESVIPARENHVITQTLVSSDYL